MSRLTIVPTNRDEAGAFIDCGHRHHTRPVGLVCCLAVADERGRTVGVATIGRPVAAALQDGYTAEVTRSCTDGTANANSALYGAAWRAVRALGYRRLVTYTQDGESGSSLRAAGFVDVSRRGPRPGWDTPARRREGRGNDHVGRVRWERADGAPPSWSSSTLSGGAS